MTVQHNTNDPLRELIADDMVEVDRVKLTKILKSYIVFDANSALNTLEKFDKLPNQEKILILLVASKAKSLLSDVEEGMTPSEIIELDVMPVGSVKSSLKKLLEVNKDIKKKDSKYYLPNYRLARYAERFAALGGANHGDIQ